jgi:hypothetical protein
VDAIHQTALSLNAKIIRAPKEDHWAPGYYSVLFEDPDGIRIEANFVPGKGMEKRCPCKSNCSNGPAARRAGPAAVVPGEFYLPRPACIRRQLARTAVAATERRLRAIDDWKRLGIDGSRMRNPGSTWPEVAARLAPLVGARSDEVIAQPTA